MFYLLLVGQQRVSDSIKTTNTACEKCGGFVEANQVKQRRQKTGCLIMHPIMFSIMQPATRGQTNQIFLTLFFSRFDTLMLYCLTNNLLHISLFPSTDAKLGQQQLK